MRPKSIAGLFFGSLALLVTSCGPLLGDDLYGRIRGTITDPSGAVIVGAKVTATNLGTGISRDTTTGPDGTYEFLQLAAPGAYDVTVNRTGFAQYQAKNISLGLNQIYVLNVALEVGAVTQQITIEALPTQIESTSMQLGSTLDSRAITDLPLNGRNWVQLQQTLPGVVAGSDRFGANAVYSTNGSQSQSNSYLVNGTDANDLPLNTPLVIPSPDAIAEVNMVTSTINPEYGRGGGAIMNATTKSGTNRFHGDAFEFYRDTGLNTRNFFSKQPTIFHQNQFGGTLGGPIKKDKAFGFFSYEGTRNRRPDLNGAGTTNVFTPDQLAGNFGELSPPGTVGSAFPLIGSDGNTYPAGTPYSTLFPDGLVPTQDFNPVSKNLVSKYVPLPNGPGNLYEFNPVTTMSWDQYITRVDYNISDKDSLWGYWFYQPEKFTDTLPFGSAFLVYGATLPGFGDQNVEHIQQYTLSWTHTFSGTTINEARFGYQRFNYLNTVPQNTVLPSSLGFTGINPQDPAHASVPVLAVTGLFTLGFSAFGPQPRIDQTYQVDDNFSRVVGRHTFKIGFDMRRSQVANLYLSRNNGAFTFGGGGTYSTGNPGLDFMLGIPDSYNQQSGGFIDTRSRLYYAYFQDQWKIRDNLTLTYGTGWQVNTPFVNKNFGGLDWNCFRPGEQSTVFPTSPVGLVFPGDPGCNDAGGATTKYNHFGPRFGFAWSPGKSAKWSLRGGYGIYFNQAAEELLLQDLGAVPFSQVSSGIADTGGSPSMTKPFVDVATGQSIPNKFPFLPPHAGASVDFTAFEPMSLNVMDGTFTVPYVQNFQLSLQRQLSDTTVFTASYVGALGNKLINALELNPAGNDSGNPICGANPDCNPFNVSAVAPESFRYPQTNANGSVIFGSVGNQATFVNSNYNSLQLTLDQKLSHGLTFRATYAWSHALDGSSSFEDMAFSNVRAADPFNMAANYGDSGFDARHRFVIAYDYTLPTVRHYHAFGFMPSRLTDGWQISGITTLQTGFPVPVGSSVATSDTCNQTYVFYNCWDRPNVVAPVKTFDPRTSRFRNKSNYWFDPSAFQAPPAGVQGNAGRNFFHGPGINNFDFVLHKNIAVTESSHFELRFEFFNLFNHAQFSVVPQAAEGNGVVGDFSSSRFGRVLSADTPNTSRIIQLGAKFVF
jgi:hypothetical protein